MIRTTLKIDGMVCGMCEAHICDAIRKAVPEAKKVTASRSKKEAGFLTETPPDADALKDAIYATGYTCLGIESAPTGQKQKGTEPDYKNWMPKGMVLSGLGITAVFLILFLVSVLTKVMEGRLKAVLSVVFLIGTIFGLCGSAWMILMYRAFSYRGRRQMSRQIIEGIAEYVDLPSGGKGLDVGCGSGALTIACAKRNPGASFIGIDRWGKEYASFSKTLCENNAGAEGVSNVTFRQGNAVGLVFHDESFDAVTSNYVYHNIPGDRQAYLLETLRVLKKGGTFALHDIFSKSKYGDMKAFLEKLKGLGYEKVELIDTTDGRFMTKQESTLLGLSGSGLLVGRK